MMMVMVMTMMMMMIVMMMMMIVMMMMMIVMMIAWFLTAVTAPSARQSLLAGRSLALAEELLRRY